MALDIQDCVANLPTRNGKSLTFRIGINSSLFVALVIGNKKFSYDVWGNAVNINSRMESQWESGKIQILNSNKTLIVGR